jgi:hypothetical protein
MALHTPVAFVIFNRPDTTLRVFETIRAARPATLLVVADGPRPDRPGEADRCAAARAVIDGVDWDCEVLTNFADTNLGCKRRISSGLDWVFSLVEEAIILEDDCVPHPDFFAFCTALLERYRDDERVMMISGTNSLLKLDIPESYLFSRYFSVWGWATWRRAWKNYDVDLKRWEKIGGQEQLKYLFPQRFVVEYLTRSYNAVQSGRIDTWDYQWGFCCLFNNGLSAVPRVNLISNIGASGTHISPSDAKSDPNLFLPIYHLGVDNIKHPDMVFANNLYDVAMFEKVIKVPFSRKFKAKLNSLVKRYIKKAELA